MYCKGLKTENITINNRKYLGIFVFMFQTIFILINSEDPDENSSKEDKHQESIQSSTTPDPGHHMVALHIRFSIDDNVNILTLFSKTIHTKFTKLASL